MVDQKDFSEIIKNLTDNNTLIRAESISNNCIRILKIDKENGLIEAEVQGNKIIPYQLTLNISRKNLYDVIYHDCPDYLARKKPNNKFCKHIVKFFYVLNNQDSVLAHNLLKKFDSIISEQAQIKKIDLLDINHFVNSDLQNQLDFEYKGFEFFFDLSELEDPARKLLKEILMEAKKFPAALRGFHGGYEGGLFDHILLVTNYAYKLCKSMNYQVDLKKAVLTAIYHDFGKISYYSFKKKDIQSKIALSREELDKAHENIVKKFNYEGRDYHVEEALAVIKKNRSVLFYDDEMYKAIIFHHGRWSKYYPIDMNELATLIHTADMIASQIHFI